MSLRTPDRGTPSPIGAALNHAFGNPPAEIIGQGMVLSSNWNPEQDGWSIGAAFDSGTWVRLSDLGVPEYGVCDEPHQVIQRFGYPLLCSEWEWAIFFVHVAKVPSNAGKGGGWRWHKWGTYIGPNSPTCEYLDDERGFADGVYTFHIYEVTG